MNNQEDIQKQLAKILLNVSTLVDDLAQQYDTNDEQRNTRVDQQSYAQRAGKRKRLNECLKQQDNKRNGFPKVIQPQPEQSRDIQQQIPIQQKISQSDPQYDCGLAKSSILSQTLIQNDINEHRKCKIQRTESSENVDFQQNKYDSQIWKQNQKYQQCPSWINDWLEESKSIHGSQRKDPENENLASDNLSLLSLPVGCHLVNRSQAKAFIGQDINDEIIVDPNSSLIKRGNVVFPRVFLFENLSSLLCQVSQELKTMHRLWQIMQPVNNEGSSCSSLSSVQEWSEHCIEQDYKEPPTKEVSVDAELGSLGNCTQTTKLQQNDLSVQASKSKRPFHFPSQVVAESVNPYLKQQEQPAQSSQNEQQPDTEEQDENSLMKSLKKTYSTVTSGIRQKRVSEAAGKFGRQIDEKNQETFEYVDVQIEDDDPLPELDLKHASFMQQVSRRINQLFFAIIKPEGALRTRWDLLIMLLLCYLSIVLPFTVSFRTEEEARTSSVLTKFEHILDALFAFDIYMNFRTAVEDADGDVIVSRKLIAKHYITSIWFFFDVITLIPFHQLGSGKVEAIKLTKSIRFVKLTKLLRILKIMRLLKLPRLMRSLEQFISRAVLSLLTFLFTAILYCHFSACLFHYVGDPEHFREGRPRKETWVTQAALEDEEPGWRRKRYITALYWALSTMTTVGYGDVSPGKQNSAEKIVAMIGMMAGVVVFAYYTGSMSTMLSALNIENARLAARRQAVDDFLRYRKIPNQLADRVRKFYHYVITHEVYSEENSIINGLSASLRTEIILYLYRDALEKVPFFQGKHPQFIVQLVTHLSMEYYAPGDIVVRQGDYGTEMYFIAEGKLQVRVYMSKSIQEYDDSPVNDTAGETLGQGPVAEGIFNRNQKVAPDKLDKEENQPNQSDLKLSSKENSDVEESSKYVLATELFAGEYFGEFSCITGEPRLATVIALNFSELYSLSRKDLQLVMSNWPEIAEEFMLLGQAMGMEHAGSIDDKDWSNLDESEQMIKSEQQEQHDSQASLSDDVVDQVPQYDNIYKKFLTAMDKVTQVRHPGQGMEADEEGDYPEQPRQAAQGGYPENPHQPAQGSYPESPHQAAQVGYPEQLDEQESDASSTPEHAVQDVHSPRKDYTPSIMTVKLPALNVVKKRSGTSDSNSSVEKSTQP